MSKKPLKAVFLDTSFLITLTDSGRKDHDVAVKFFSFWFENRVKMFVSAICYAEYLTKAESLPGYILNAIEVVPFNAEAASLAGQFMRQKDKLHSPAGIRDALKDDVKIVASAIMYNVSALAHCDGNSMSKFISQAHEIIPDAKNLKSILIADGYDEGTASLGEPFLPFVD